MRNGPNRLRWRLTLVICLVAVVSGAVLLVIMYSIAQGLDGDVRGFLPQKAPAPPPVPGQGPLARPDILGPVHEQSSLLTVPAVALAIMTALSLAFGWLIAGRLLRPVRTMAERLQHISERNVHERLAVTGPRDELKDLADTVDGLLGRLETSLDAHKRFVANAAHELRTPLTVEHALLEEPLIDPDADVEAFRANFQRLMKISAGRARLLESLLTLSSSEHDQPRDEPFDLAAIVTEALAERSGDLDRAGLRAVPSLEPARIYGDPLLVARLVANLCDNAIHYNAPGGRVEVAVRALVGRVSFAIANTGPVVPPDQVDRLFEPFQRMQRTADDGHHGLGLSIVRAIATAHAATLKAHPRPGGGLVVEVTFPSFRT
ncbi:HAMP domain-containing sensor histidine kinase [Dactylosporangium sp. CA-152071]|uniref:HAMP domain-containing sensor histidine kinase n=1 Tax=Dactylosporangium sp. CA-152071 TaxID=3239933 RepID=UPI003D8A2EE8